jgi:hypothetical protein
MSILYIAEVTHLGFDAGGQSIAAPKMPPIAEQTVAIGMSSAASNPFSGHTRFVQIHTDASCSIAFGNSPTATSSNQRLAANDTRYYSVAPGLKVAVITNS